MLGSPLVCEGKLVAIVSHIEWQTQTATATAGQCGSAIGSISGGRIEPTASAAAAAGWGNKSGLPDVFSDVAFANQWISSHLSVKRKRKPVGGRRRSSSKLRQSQRRNESGRMRCSSGSGFVLAWVLVLNGLARWRECTVTMIIKFCSSQEVCGLPFDMSHVPFAVIWKQIVSKL